LKKKKKGVFVPMIGVWYMTKRQSTQGPNDRRVKKKRKKTAKRGSIETRGDCNSVGR